LSISPMFPSICGIFTTFPKNEITYCFPINVCHTFFTVVHTTLTTELTPRTPVFCALSQSIGRRLTLFVQLPVEINAAPNRAGYTYEDDNGRDDVVADGHDAPSLLGWLGRIRLYKERMAHFCHSLFSSLAPKPVTVSNRDVCETTQNN
jgi:hypothetical protein